jgi:poly(hydroxyalkanoate) depolymerase family esterase
MKTQKTYFYFLLIVLILMSCTLYAGTWEQGSYSGILGARNYRVYIPNDLPQGRHPSLVVMIHGCDQSADDFAKGSQIEKWADNEKFIALFPEQNIMYNPFKCWNWVIPSFNSRSGEAGIIITMIDQVIQKYSVDTNNVFAAGMSSGASMVSILGNCFPERFKALGSHDGTQFYASATGLDYAQVVLNGASVTSEVAANIARGCSYFAANKPSKMPIIIFHGMNSPLMSPVHAFQVENEFKAFNDYLDNDRRDNSYLGGQEIVNIPETETYGYNLYKTSNHFNEVIIERYMVDKLGHDWSGGAANFKYNDPKGPDATGLMVKFFKRFGL